MKPGPLLCTIVCASVLSSHAAIFQFDLAGRATPGLSGANEATQNSSPATGLELSPGISYDDSTHQLTLHFGWGSADAVGSGGDLTGDFFGAYIQGPSNPDGTTSGVLLYNLTSFEADLNTGGRSGFVDLPDLNSGTPPALQLLDNPSGSGFTVAQQEAQLIAGQWYLNVASDAFNGGEIRGQLTPVPEPAFYGVALGALLVVYSFYGRDRNGSVQFQTIDRCRLD